MPLGFAQAFIKTSSEGAFKRAVKELIDGVSVENFLVLAEMGMTFQQLVEKSGRTAPETRPNAWTDHLTSLSNERYLEMIGEVSARHADVLRAYPKFAEEITNGLRQLVVPR